MLILLALFNLALMRQVLLPFSLLAIVACVGGYLWSQRPAADHRKVSPEANLKNPLEVLTSFLFAFIFLLVILATHLSVKYLGIRGIYYLAALVGGMDVDPFVMGLTQTAGTAMPYQAAATALIIAASANNFFKGIYALVFGDRKTGIQTAVGLILLTLAGLATLLWIY
jgi:uncharacterized membrane protein (DUF4010 family)